VSAAIASFDVQFGANAQVIDIPTFLFVIASPNPVGVVKSFMLAPLSVNPAPQAQATTVISMKT